ncbi:dynein axonemal assembly factor 8 isoform X1 [Tenrec ecaudatus]|uniref:dynein axonemal assembly factor 8 isoform X1 n=1 Tax=Tenrec ecaudatus TaxID=94439 RepID=UPI003F5A4A91
MERWENRGCAEVSGGGVFPEDNMLRSTQDVDPSMSRDVKPPLGHPWDAILQAAKEQIPTLDSDADSSSNGCEEDGELFIFQRDPTALIPDLSEELAEEDPPGDGVPEGWTAAVDEAPREVHGTHCLDQPTLPEQRGSFFPGGESRGQEGKELALVAATVEPTSQWTARPQGGSDPRGPFQSYGEPSSLLRFSKESPSCQQCYPSGPQGEAPTSLAPGAPHATSLSSEDLRALRRERREMIERDILRKVTQGPRDASSDHRASKMSPRAGPGHEVPMGDAQASGPILSLQRLEELDLDAILQSLVGQEKDHGDSGEPGAAWWAADRQGREPLAPATQDRLMERLTLLCTTQSRPSASTWSVPVDRAQDTSEWAASHRQAPARLGLQATRGQAPNIRMRLPRPAEPPTVFIDLRQASLPDSLSPDSSSSSSSESEDDMVASRGEQGPAEGAPPCPQGLRGCTGKSQLLQQLRAFQKGTAVPRSFTGKNPSGQKAQGPKEVAESGSKRKQHVKLWAERQDIPATSAGGRPRALGGPLVPGRGREAIALPLGPP